MSLVNSKQLLLDAQKGGYAVGAFNAENLEMIQAIVLAAEETNMPVIIQTTPSTLKYANCDEFFAMASAVCKNSSAKVALHLDHGDSFETAMKAFRAGYTSIMIDGSKLDFEGNIALTKKVVEACGNSNVQIEAELGKVGGKEDSLEVKGETPYTDPQEAKEFVERTNVDSLAVGIGTSHGFYKGEPNVSVERLAEIRKVVDIPLVLHGTSGVPDTTVRECIKNGICKVNYATDLRVAYTNAVREVLKDEEVYDPKKYGNKARESVKQLVIERINMLSGK